jgi:hypothetical protein
VRVQVIPEGATAPSLPASHGEAVPSYGRLHVAFPIDGRVTLPAPPGRYRVVVSHGPFYDLSDTTVTVTAGMSTRVAGDAPEGGRDAGSPLWGLPCPHDALTRLR